MFRKLSRWLPTMSRKPIVNRPRKPLALESLEAREVPAAHIWAGPASGGFWNNAANWNGGTPTMGELGPITVTFNSAVTSTQNIPGLDVSQINFNHTGSTIHLSANLGLDGSVGTQIVDATGGNTIDSTSGVLILTGNTDVYVQTNAGTLTIKSDIVGTVGLIKSGSATLELQGASSYTGATSINDGVLALNNVFFNQALPNRPINIGDTFGNAESAELELLSPEEIPDTAAVTVNGDGVFNLHHSGNDETIGSLVMNGGVVRTADASLIVNGGTQVTANASILAGPSSGVFGLSPTDHTIDVASGKSLVISAQIAGTGNLLKTGDGTLSFVNASITNANSYTGITFVKNGGLILQDAAANSAFKGELTIGDGIGLPGSAFVQLNAGNEIPDDKLLGINFDGQLNLNGHNEAVGPLVIDGGGTVQNTGAAILTLTSYVSIPASVNTHSIINSNIDLGSDIHTFTVSNPFLGLIVNGQITGGVGAGLVKDGAGTMEIQGTLNTPNTFGGYTFVRDGVLALNDSGLSEATSKTVYVGDGVGGAGSAVLRLLQSAEIPDSADISIGTDGLLDLNGNSDAIGGLVLESGSAITTGAGTLTISGNVSVSNGGGPLTPATITGHLDLGAADRTFSFVNGGTPDLIVDASISGSGGLIKDGPAPAKLVLNGANTYTGTTTITDGILLVNGVQAGSAVKLNGGVLGGTGHVGVLTGTGGQVAPGASPGTLTTQNLHLGGSTYVAELNGVAAGQYDQIQVVGTADITGSTLSPVVNFSSKFGNSFKILDNNNNDPVVGTFAGLAEGDTLVAGGRTFQISYHGGDGNDVVLTDHTPDSFAVGAGDGGSSSVQVFNADGTAKTTVQAFDNSFTGGVRTASGDVTGDGVADLIAGTGPGVPAELRIYDGVTNQLVRTIPAFEGFTGGVFVTTGDFNHDGHSDLIVTPDLGGGPRVTVFSGLDGSVMANFYGITDPNFRGGARTAVGDMNGDGTPDVCVSAGFGGGPRVTAFDGTTLVGGNPTKLFNDIFVFEAGLRNGAYLAAGDVDGDGKADLIAGAGPGGGPRVYALSGADLMNGMANGSTQLANFFGGNPDNRAGIRVVAKNLDGDSKADIIVGDGEGAGSQVTSYLGKNIPSGGTPAVDGQFNAYPGFMGGVFVG